MSHGMKSVLTDIAVYGSLGYLVILAALFGNPFAYNAALFFVWFLIVTGILSMIVVPDKVIKEKGDWVHIHRFFKYGFIGLLASCNWMVTAGLLLFIFLIHDAKYQLEMTKRQEENHE